MNLKKIINFICIIFMLCLITSCMDSNSSCIHNTKWNVEQEPTCQTVGKQSQICLDCNKILLSETIKKLDHDFEWIIDKEASTNEDGIKHQECKLCHTKQNENTKFQLDIHIHSLTHVLQKDPTCTNDGNIEYYKCKVCKNYYQDENATTEILESSSIIKASHNLSKIEKLDKTCTTSGNIEYYKCLVCNKCYKDSNATTGINESDTIIQASHNLIHHEVKEATCTRIGWDAYDTCNDCDYTTYYKIEALRHNFENDECTRCHIKKDQLYKIEGNYIYFGEYPQTLKEDSVTIISNTLDSDGYYLGSDNNRYAKVVARPRDTYYYFNNKTSIIDGTIYYFKVEPIKWQILEQSNGTYKLLSTLIIDHQMYYSSWDSRTIDGKTVYANNYKYSDIRNWLNNEFYNKAFIDDLKIYINTTLVDNSASTTGYTTNNYACENTNDKVYLPSYSDMVNTLYGFNSDTSRQKQVTDYAKAIGCYMDTSSFDYNNGYFWLHSPDFSNGEGARIVVGLGGVHYGSVYNSDVGVAPAITITI